jgi:hypothetical protein
MHYAICGYLSRAYEKQVRATSSVGMPPATLHKAHAFYSLAMTGVLYSTETDLEETDTRN